MSNETIVVNKADLAGKDRTITSQQSKIAELEQKLADSTASPVKRNDNRSNDASAFSNDDQDTLGELYEPMKRLIAGSIAGVSGDMQSGFDTISKSIKGLQTNIESQNRSLFQGVATTTLNNYEKVKGSDEFEALLDTKIKGTNITYRDSWADAESRNSITEMQEIVDMVKPEQSAEANEAEEQQKESKTEYEPKGSSSESSQQMGSQFLFKASDLQIKVDQFKEGAISTDEMEKFEVEFNAAIDKGQVMNDLEE